MLNTRVNKIWKLKVFLACDCHQFAFSYSYVSSYLSSFHGQQFPIPIWSKILLWEWYLSASNASSPIAMQHDQNYGYPNHSVPQIQTIFQNNTSSIFRPKAFFHCRWRVPTCQKTVYWHEICKEGLLATKPGDANPKGRDRIKKAGRKNLPTSFKLIDSMFDSPQNIHQIAEIYRKPVPQSVRQIVTPYVGIHDGDCNKLYSYKTSRLLARASSRYNV